MTTLFTTGAYSSAHHALIDRLEESTAGSSEAQSEKAELLHTLSQHTSSHKLAECLVMLMNADLYDECVHDLHMSKALYDAISLAERGSSIEERRLGYLYVALYAPSDAHTDWQLMLVNTLKKDLESESAPRILMALGFIIHRPFAGIVPMISAVMITLLGDKSSVVQLRSLQAMSRLLDVAKDGFDDDVLHEHVDIEGESDDGVLIAKLRVAEKLHPQNKEERYAALLRKLQCILDDRDAITRHTPYTLRLLKTLDQYSSETKAKHEMQLPTEELLEQLSRTASPYRHAIGVEVMRHAENADHVKTYIKQLIHDRHANSPNYRYGVLAHLLALSPTTANSVLGEEETVYVMETLEHPDITLRRKAMQVLAHINIDTLRQYHQLLLQTSPEQASECDDYLTNEFV